jgi:SpoVK/Ycf46/Vps4 family AAA+-type ATPase
MYKKIGKIIVDKQNLEVLEACLKINEPLLLVGETGTGKTGLISELAKKSKTELHRISVNGSTGIDEILGKWLIENSTTKWQDGILITAMKKGHWVVFDEINSALPEILFSLHSLLDDDKKITLVEKENEVIKPHKNFRFFGSMNPSDEYAGTKDMNKAFLSRFNAILNIDLLPPLHEKKALVNQSGIDELTAVEFVSIAQKLREKKNKNEIYYFCSTRDLIQAGKLFKSGICKENSLKFAVYNKMSRDELCVVKDCIETVQHMFENNKHKYMGIIEKMDDFENQEIKLVEQEDLINRLEEKLRKQIEEKEKIEKSFNNLAQGIAEQIKTLAQNNSANDEPNQF